MQPRAYLEVLTPGRRRVTASKKLGLEGGPLHGVPRHRGNGANNHLELLPALGGSCRPVQAIVICGRNQQAYNELVHWRAQHPEFNCFIDSYSDVVHLLMQASDAIVTRGGTTTCAKALHFKCPIIFNAFGGIMPQERAHGEILPQRRCGRIDQNAAQFRALIDHWMADPGAYERLRENFLQLRYEEDPTVLIDELVGLARRRISRERARRFHCPTATAGADRIRAVFQSQRYYQI
jgi:processive 1,2-diacylglycerol beta-glucosyltransferase